MTTSGIFRAGTSGLVLAEPNKQAYPREFQHKHRLIYYASQFNSIEINSSFYKLPRCLTYEKWCDMVPDNFQFTVKLWKGVTHEAEYNARDLSSFMLAIDCLKDKKGCLLIQFPSKTRMDINSLGKLLESIQILNPLNSWRIAVEFRHPLWYHKGIYELLNATGASIVLHDMPESIPPELNERAGFVYLRFHGEKGDYRGNYEDHFLATKATEIRRWLREGKDVYAYFNNTIGAAVSNLKTLKDMIG